mmetsp:Transcript_10225/g.25934  ORF Transcript_10225/g.25934 Transcript_10225/m.25934 type:complete len:114 (+) Transcript_10225:1-342(+)
MFMILERHKEKGRVYQIDIGSGTNVLNHPKADSLAFEDPDFDLEKNGVRTLDKEFVFKYPSSFLEDRNMVLSEKVEGLAYIDENLIALSNDNDFGKHGEPSRVWVVQFESQTY